MINVRNWADLFLLLAIVGYASLFVVSLFGNVFLIGVDRPISTLDQAFLAILSLLAIGLYRATHQPDGQRIAAVLFAAWFVVAAGAAMAIDLRWAIGVALSGAVPLILCLGWLRSPGQAGARKPGPTT